jgi:hypothetical protein
MKQQIYSSTNFEAQKSDSIDLTQADLDRGLTPEQIAREKADLNWGGFRRDVVKIIQDALAQESEMQK